MQNCFVIYIYSFLPTDKFKQCNRWMDFITALTNHVKRGQIGEQWGVCLLNGLYEQECGGIKLWMAVTQEPHRYWLLAYLVLFCFTQYVEKSLALIHSLCCVIRDTHDRKDPDLVTISSILLQNVVLLKRKLFRWDGCVLLFSHSDVRN